MNNAAETVETGRDQGAGYAGERTAFVRCACFLFFCLALLFSRARKFRGLDVLAHCAMVLCSSSDIIIYALVFDIMVYLRNAGWFVVTGEHQQC